MIRKVFTAYILPLILSGTGFIMPEDTNIQIYIGYACYIAAFLILGYGLFRNYYKKQNIRKPTTEHLLEEFTFVDPPGYYTHPKYSYPICPSCLNKTKIISPVSKIDKNAWYCTVCDKPMAGSQGEVFTVDW